MKLTRGQIIAGILCIIPFILLTIGYFTDSLTADPILALILRSGRTAVNLLMLSLLCRPLSNLLSLTALLKVRITLGNFAFFYALFHFLVFSGLDFEFNPVWIWQEIRRNTFIYLGIAALLLLIPLAITSITKIRIKMGKSWQVLHRIVYMIAILAIIHYFMASKGDYTIPVLYGTIFLLLMLFRLPPLNKIRMADQPRWLEDLNRFLLKS
jgi:sulfoxide reductase heme-binding subunit YedZ